MMKVIVVLLMSILFSCGTGVKSADGKKIGQIVKLGEYGVLCKTYEGELIRGGFNSGSGANGAEFHFTILQKELYNKMMISMERQDEIEIEYTKSVLVGPCTADSASQGFVTSYKILKEGK